MPRMAKVLELPIACPYCHVGRVHVHVEERNDGTSELLGAADPRQCPSCKKYFKLQIRLHVVGKPLPEHLAGRGASSGDVLRSIIAST